MMKHVDMHVQSICLHLAADVAVLRPLYQYAAQINTCGFALHGYTENALHYPVALLWNKNI